MSTKELSPRQPKVQTRSVAGVTPDGHALGVEFGHASLISDYHFRLVDIENGVALGLTVQNVAQNTIGHKHHAPLRDQFLTRDFCRAEWAGR